MLIRCICIHDRIAIYQELKCSGIRILLYVPVMINGFHMCSYAITVAQLSINGTTVDSVTDRDNEPQYHVKEDAGSITLCIRVESFPEEKDNLTINYFTSQSTACKFCNT